jgi:hypothetical protein
LRTDAEDRSGVTHGKAPMDQQPSGRAGAGGCGLGKLVSFFAQDPDLGGSSCLGFRVSTPDETYRATMRVQTPEHGPATLIVARQGSRTWLTLKGSIRSTAVLTDQQVAELTTKLRTNTDPCRTRDTQR